MSSSLELAVGRLLFFFQAEDGIRDRDVTGVQTCALPISGSCESGGVLFAGPAGVGKTRLAFECLGVGAGRGYRTAHVRANRSEERRVGKECRSGWWRYQ